MGNESSRLEDPFDPYPRVRPARSIDAEPVSPKDTATSKDVSSKATRMASRPASARPASMTAKMQRPSSANPHSAQSSPELHYSPAQQRLLDKAKENKVWMRTNQTAVSSAAEIRQPKPRFPWGGRPISARPDLASQLGQLLKEDDEKPSRTVEEVLEEKKAEFVGKLSTYMKRGVKPPPDLHLPRVAVPPLNMVKPSPSAKASWMRKLAVSKADIMAAIKERMEEGRMYEPMTQEGVGGEVQKSLGDTYDTFAGYQGTVNHFIETGLTDELLSEIFMDEEAEQQLTTYEKWSIVRHAAEQVLQVYTNRSNARWVEAEEWSAPAVVDATTSTASIYSGAVDSALNQGQVALMFIDDGRLVEAGETSADISALMATDLWQAIKVLAPHKVPSGHRLERMSVMGRHLLQAALCIELAYGAGALKALKVVVAVDCEQEHFLVAELQTWRFFGLNHRNVAILPLPRFHGFAQDMRRGTLAHVRGSPRLLMGTGYALFLTNSPAEAYTLDESGTQPTCIPGTVLEWLRENKANWLYTGLFSDLERLRGCDTMIDTQFLSASLYTVERGGANMAMEVMAAEEGERDVRGYDSVVLGRSRAREDGTSNWAGNCNLKASAMRTVRSYQIMSSHMGDAYVATGRYAFKVSALQRLLVDTGFAHADVRLHGFYAYASLDLGDITTFPGAMCGAVLSRPPGCGAPKPPATSEVVLPRTWLSYAANVLEAQDKVNEFRQRAINLVRPDRLGPAGAGGVVQVDASAQHFATSPQFKERRTGLQVVLLLAPEHRGMVRACIKLGRTFIHNIVDRLHVVVMMAANDSKDLGDHILEEVSDKELEFNGQLSRELTWRSNEVAIADSVTEIVKTMQAGLVIVPSHKLAAGGTSNLGGESASLAYQVAKHITSVPVLVVKSNSVSRYAPPNGAGSGFEPGQKEHLTVMSHLEFASASPMIDMLCKFLTPNQDVLYLTRTQAFECPGQLSMRARRVFVQARMAVSTALRVEERAYPGQVVPELCKAVETEVADLLVVSVAGELPISREVEELLKSVKTSVYIFRNKDALTSLAPSMALQVEEAAPTEGYSYGAGSSRR